MTNSSQDTKVAKTAEEIAVAKAKAEQAANDLLEMESNEKERASKKQAKKKQRKVKNAE